MPLKIRSVKLYKTIYSVSNVSHIKVAHVAVVGRSNVGKSSFLNKVMGAKLTRVSSKPGKTQSINLYLLNDKVVLVDLPGYGYAKISSRKQESWKELVETYFKLNMDTKLVFMLIDARIGITHMDIQMREWLDYYGIPYVVVATKIDKLNKNDRRKAVDNIKLSMNGMDIIPFSSKTGEGKLRILGLMRSLL